MTVRVVADSTSYVPEEELTRLGISTVQLSATLAGVTRAENDIDSEAFYRQMRSSGEFPSSSQPSVGSITDAFDSAIEAGEDVVAVVLSSRMSGTFETACMVREQVLARMPQGHIEIVDSESNSMQEGFAVLAAARAAHDGADTDAVVAAARSAMRRSRWLFAPATLEYLRIGGRIGNAAALLGALLQVRPILTVEQGVTSTVRTVRTQRRALRDIAEMVAADSRERGLTDAVVHHILAPDVGEELADEIERLTGLRPRMQLLGPVIGLHVGPGSVGVVYLTERPLPGRGPSSAA
jgi:DegV family protein with EDD domain